MGYSGNILSDDSVAEILIGPGRGERVGEIEVEFGEIVLGDVTVRGKSH